ncbi:XdhC family protein [Herbaspirillum autotrophicum]|uniref:XdhC family protein n=1 Tax=Herbaspirillum autotrophicum TaxID=180195 RepID=UPI00067D8B94|nr:XdhC family protein [Herbaspirillum autotrophicum]
MESIDFEVLAAAQRWHDEGHYVLLGTVVHTWGSAPRPIGSMMAIRADGHVRGSVSGGCVEDDLIQRVQSGELRQTTPFELRYGLNADEAHRFGLPCGGTLALVMEPVSAHSALPELLAAISQGLLVTRTLDLATSIATIKAGTSGSQTRLADGRLQTQHGPRYRLIIIGAAHMSRYVAQFALALDYHVIVCDPRPEYLDEWDVAGVELSREMPDDLLLRLQLDSHSAVVTLTHDPKLDDMALLEALKSAAFYIGAIGSRTNHARRRERLTLFDISPAEIDKLHGPVGLHLGARTPPEIAIAILAEMTAIRNGVEIKQSHVMRTEDSGSAPCIVK